MMLVDAYPVTTKLWLAARPSRREFKPEAADDHPEIHMRALRILIVEDEFFISLDVKAMLTDLGHTVVGIAVSAEQAVALADLERPDVVLMDIRLVGDRDGIEAAAEIVSRFGIRSIFITAHTDPVTRQRVAAVTPFGFLEKPLTKDRLRGGLLGI